MSDAKQMQEAKQQEYWLADAASIDSSILDLESYVAKTAAINEFISSNKYIVAAPKGYGKTLILKYRRMSNKERYENQNPLVIPTNIEIDSFDNAIPFDQNFEVFLKSQSAWENLWQIAIGFSMVIHYALLTGNSEFLSDFVKRFSGRNNKRNNKLALVGISERISKKLTDKLPVPTYEKIQVNPSSVLALLLTASLSDLQASIAHALDVIHQWCLAIDQPIFLYVDQIDQGVKDFPVDLWRNAQNGIVGAIFRLHNSNKHIKVYSSIRLEAWTCCESELHSQYKDYVSTLDYREDDLKSIFEHAVLAYENERIDRNVSNPIQKFIGLEKIHNSWSGKDEDVFEYMLRHSLRRPRDLIILGGGVHDLYKEKRLTKENFCSMVNRIPGEEIRQQYFIETYRFSESLGSVNTQRFFMLTHKNIFTLDEMVDICSKYNNNINCAVNQLIQTTNQTTTELCKTLCKECTAANHIFCDLYRIGLLGIIKSEEVKSDKSRYQHFNPPGHIRSEHLPNSPFFLLHPAMDHYIKDELANNMFLPVRGIIVGQGLEWLPQNDQLIYLGKISVTFRTCGLRIEDGLWEALEQLVYQAANIPAVDATTSTETTTKPIFKDMLTAFRNMVTLDALLKGTSFLNNIVAVIDKLRNW
jgi:hypothetical protein